MIDDKKIQTKHIRFTYKLIVRVFTPYIVTLMGGYKVFGRENMPAEGPALLCSNHISYLDPPIIGTAFNYRRCCYMGKGDLFRIPLFGPFIRYNYVYYVDKDEGGRQAIRTATELLESGELLVLFPEGTRSPDGELMKGEAGAAFIAMRAHAPIIPIALWGTDVMLQRHSKILHRTPVYVNIGKPMYVPEPQDGSKLSREEINAFTDRLIATIAELFNEIDAQVPEKWRKKRAQYLARNRSKLTPEELEISRSQARFQEAKYETD